jgi:hypothetical protein
MSSKNYYDSIDEMPLYNWRLCQGKQQFIYCRKNLDESDKRKCNPDKDLLAWEKIYNTYITEFGLGKEFHRIDELRTQIAELQLDFIINNVQYIRNEIELLKGELEDLLGRPSEGDSDTVLIHLSKWMGYKIEPKETTVREFFKMIREYEKEIERLNKQAS